MSLLAVDRPNDGHAAFRAWLTALEPGPPGALIAGHAAHCEDCQNAVVALDALGAIDTNHPHLPAASARAHPEAPIFAWARYAIPLVVIVVLAVVRPDIGSVVAPQGSLLEAVADPEQGVLGDWGSVGDPATGSATDAAGSPVPAGSDGSPQPSLAPGAVPTDGATPTVSVLDPSGAPLPTAASASASGSLPPGATPPSSIAPSQPSEPTPTPSSDPTVPPPPTPTPEPTPPPTPTPTPDPTPPPTPTPGDVLPECANLIDDDGDGLVDLLDPGCLNSLDLTED